MSTERAPSGTSPQGNKAPFGSGSIGPGTGTTALPLAAMALSQKWYTGRGDKAGARSEEEEEERDSIKDLKSGHDDGGVSGASNFIYGENTQACAE